MGANVPSNNLAGLPATKLASVRTETDIIAVSRKEPSALKDLAGLKLRAPGGPKYSARLQALGSTPVFIRFEDLALALTQGTVDGVMTNDGGVVQGKLWELGIKYAINVDLGMLCPMRPVGWFGADESCSHPNR